MRKNPPSCSRVSANGPSVTRRLLSRTRTLVAEAMLGTPGPYAVQAAIAAEHCKAARAEDTNWPEILRLYELLYRVQPSPVVALNRAVALAMVAGPRSGLAQIEDLVNRHDLADYHLLYAAQADLMRRLGLWADAARSYARALNLVANHTERRFLERRLREMQSAAAT